MKVLGLRFYSAILARWVSRDPIGERGFRRAFYAAHAYQLQASSRQVQPHVRHRVLVLGRLRGQEFTSEDLGSQLGALEEPSEGALDAILNILRNEIERGASRPEEDSILGPSLLHLAEQYPYLFGGNSPIDTVDSLGLMTDAEFYRWWLGVQARVGVAIGLVSMAEQMCWCASLSSGESVVVQTAATRILSFSMSPILAPFGYIIGTRITRWGATSLDCEYELVLIPIGPSLAPRPPGIG